MNRLSIAVLVLLIASCATSRSPDEDELPDPDGGREPVDQTPDAAFTPSDAGAWPGHPDASAPHVDSSVPDHDAAPAIDGGEAPDAEISDDAAIDASLIIPDPEPLPCAEVTEEPHVQLGTPQAPLQHAFASGVLQGSVDWRGRAFIRLTGLTAGQPYVIVLTGEDLLLSLFAGSDAFGTATCIDGSTDAASPATCVFVPENDAIDITVEASHNVQPFTLRAVAVGAAEGTMEAPLAIPLGDLPRELNVEPDQTSYYEITGLTPGTTYVVTGHSSAPFVELDVYKHSSFDNYSEPQLSPAGAVGQPSGTSLLVSVLGPPTGESVALDVAPASYASEGTAEAPVMLDASELPYDGELGWSYSYQLLAPGVGATQGFYTITGVAPGDYVISLDAPPNTQLFIYEGAFGGPARCTTFARRALRVECGAHLSGAPVYVRLLGYSSGGSPITLDVVSAPLHTEGTQLAPLEIARTELPRAGQALSGTSFYRITGLIPRQAYVARVSNIEAWNAVLQILDDEARMMKCEVMLEGDEMACLFVPAGTSVTASVLVGRVGDGRSTGATFVLDLIEVDAAPTSTYAQPIPIQCTTGRVESMLSAAGASFYRISGLEYAAPYVIEARSRLRSNITVFAELPEPFESDQQLCFATGEGSRAARCQIALTHGDSVIVRAQGEAIVDPIELVVRRPHAGSQGTAEAPVEIDQLPYTGHVATASTGYFAIHGLTPGATYRLHVATAHEQVMVTPYGDLARLNPRSELAASPGDPAELQVSAATEAMLLEINLLSPSDWVTDVRIDLVPE